MAITISVTYHVTKPEPELQSYDLRVEVTAATEMPEEIFIMHSGIAPVLRAGEGNADAFQCIADPVDLEELPVDEPDLDNDIPYYRVSDITLNFRDLETLEETKGYIEADIQNLVDSLKAADDLEEEEDVVYA